MPNNYHDAILPKRRQDLHVEKFADECVLYDQKRRRIHVLNVTALIVWSACDGETSMSDIAHKIINSFNEAKHSVVLEDVAKILVRFRQEGLLEP